MRQRISIVVDDEPQIRAYVSAILQQADFETVEAVNGADGLEAVRTREGRVDLVVSDIQMPGGDGLTLASSLKETYPQVPVILVSGFEQPPDGFAFLQKPFAPAALLETVRSVTTRPRTRTAGGG